MRNSRQFGNLPFSKSGRNIMKNERKFCFQSSSNSTHYFVILRGFQTPKIRKSIYFSIYHHLLELIQKISGNELGYYSLNAVSGEITVAKSLRDQFGESILTIRATDSGKYPLSGTYRNHKIEINSRLKIVRSLKI